MSKDNLVIARYMEIDGGEFEIKLERWGWFDKRLPKNFDCFKYHKSWDWLIPVINKLGGEQDISMEIRHGEHPFCLSRGVSKEYKRSYEIIVCEDMTGIETAYKAVLESIKFLKRPKN